MKLLGYCVVLGLFSSACTLKKLNDLSQEGLYGPQYSSTFSWAQDSVSGQKLNPIRTMQKRSPNVFENDVPVTLPSNVPANLTITSDCDPGLQDQVTTVKAYRVTDSDPVELPLTYKFSSDQITVEISGIRTFLSSDSSNDAEVDLILSGDQGVVSEYHYHLRTPPSKVTFQERTRSDLTNLDVELLGSGYLQPNVSGTEFTLVRYLAVTNDEDLDVSFKVPRRLAGVARQYAQNWTFHRINDCPSDWRDQYHVADVTELYAENFYAIQLDKTYVSELSNSVKFPSDVSPKNFLVPAKSTIYIGLYSSAPCMTKWSKTGTLPMVTLNPQKIDLGCDRNGNRMSGTGYLGYYRDWAVLMVADIVGSLQYTETESLGDDGDRTAQFLNKNIERLNDGRLRHWEGL